MPALNRFCRWVPLPWQTRFCARTKWIFPNAEIGPGQFLIVFASDKDLATPELHANFRLSSVGEYLALVEPDGVTISHEFAPTFPAQLTDVSYGLSMSSVDTDLVIDGAADSSTPGDSPVMLPDHAVT